MTNLIGKPAQGIENLLAPHVDRPFRARQVAHWILQEFDRYYVESRGIPARAKSAFERRDSGASLELSRRRLSIYSESIHALGPRVVAAFPALARMRPRARAARGGSKKGF